MLASVLVLLDLGVLSVEVLNSGLVLTILLSKLSVFVGQIRVLLLKISNLIIGSLVLCAQLVILLMQGNVCIFDVLKILNLIVSVIKLLLECVLLLLALFIISIFS